jgi:hypothetical protein
MNVGPLADSFLACAAARIRALGRRVIADVIEIGRLLADCKDQCGHGNWLPWIKREFGWSADTAERLSDFTSSLTIFLKLRNMTSRSAASICSPRPPLQRLPATN